MKIPKGLLIAGLAVLALILSGCPQSGSDTASNATNTAAKPAPANPAPAKPAATQMAGWTGDAIDFMYAGFNGTKGSASDFAGKPLVVNFWATW